MIKVANLTKRFGHITALDNISFEVARGEIVGFLGPNGAGKTTTMRILSCYMPATGGSVSIGGTDIFSDSLTVRERIGYLPENAPLYYDMHTVDYLKFRGRIKGLHGKQLRKRIDEVCTLCGLEDCRKRTMANLSKGYKQRIGLADALLHEPELLILDEPTIGLDPNQIRNIRQLIRNLADQHTVFLSSHLLAEVDMVCQRVLIINRGHIVASDTPANLAGLLKGNALIIAEVSAGSDDPAAMLSAVKGVSRVSVERAGEWARCFCECEKDSDVRHELFRLASERKWGLRELREERKSLEDIFLALTNGEEGQESAR